MRYGVATLVFCALIAGVFGMQPAGAMKAFFEQFKALYVKPKSTDHAAQIFNLAVEKKGCTVCHRGQPNKPAKGYNAYGAQLAQLLTKASAQDPSAIRAAMKKVAAMKSNPADAASATFAQRLRQGKLPVGEINVQPAKSAAAN